MMMEVPELVTPAGAALFAVLATQAAKILGMPHRYARAVCLLNGVIANMAALIAFADSLDLPLFLAVIPSGLVSGLAGVAAFDAGRSGVEYEVVSKDEHAVLTELAEVGLDHQEDEED